MGNRAASFPDGEGDEKAGKVSILCANREKKAYEPKVEVPQFWESEAYSRISRILSSFIF